jgi:hypothetical protein
LKEFAASQLRVASLCALRHCSRVSSYTKWMGRESTRWSLQNMI